MQLTFPVLVAMTVALRVVFIVNLLYISESIVAPRQEVETADSPADDDGGTRRSIRQLLHMHKHSHSRSATGMY